MTDLLRGAGGGKGATSNRLYYGDNLTIMQSMPSACIDLIYLDPPFNSQRTYNLIYKQATGLPVPELEEAFCDSWELDPEKEEMARRMPIVLREYGVDESLVQFWSAWIAALRNTQPRILAYLVYMSYRLLEMKRILRPEGSLYLHCDPTASHYIKVVLDGIFGHAAYRNEIIWERTFSHNFKAKNYARSHDVLLYYAKGSRPTFNVQYQPYSEAQLSRYKKDETGKLYKAENLTFSTANTSRQFEWRGTKPPAHRSWGASIEQLEEWYKQGKILLRRDGSPRMDGLKVYLDEMPGKPISTIWTDVERIGNTSAERLGYPTQKPIKLLDRIIKTSSNEGDVVFDPFCGCGTAVYAAHINKRKWIGCDIAILSVRIVRDVLLKRYGLREDEHYSVTGIPLSVDGAQDLFARDPRQFQHWVVELAGGFANNRHSGDQGVDGRLYFETDDGLKNMVISVKGGKLTPAFTRELRGTMERDATSLLSGLICLQDPTKGMREEAAKAGQFTYRGKAYDRMQIRTAEDLLAGKGFHTPSQVQTMDWKKQGELPL